ncbi:UDP-glucose 4-epimerase [Paenibacillus swuensis]|uniref:UDP-glucose 4-epimerase n=1 Tax=Paenibacillus swuensis TaxID=1178515 RepID=A0A172TGR3_9BACL|nr:NAD-dependent epimerase/dehydratase family protein [Paenibacillus swuensis]ANE46084.1 UDP-glucose 4-epimerase [Paenibacillus swuensis]
MKAVVTGGAGFIGSHLAEALLAEGWEVHVADNLTTGRKAYIPQNAVLHAVDITEAGLSEIFGGIRPDVVYHLAAQADVKRSIDDPAYDAGINIVGTLRVLEAARDCGAVKVVIASTSAVYGNLERDLLTETDLAEPVSFYGLSKLAAERYCKVYRDLFGLDYTVLRFANVYGPKQTAKGEGGVAAVFMEQLAKGLPLTVHGDGEQTRDFIYVGDVVEALMAAGRGAGTGATLHVSTGERTSVNELVALVRELHGPSTAVVHKPARTGDIRHSCLDNARAREQLGWAPVTGVREGIARTYGYFMGI